jgi:hypothetical protein
MVTKGIPWDDLPDKHRGITSTTETHVNIPSPQVELEERNPINDTKLVLKRAAFGLVCGSLTGACFGFVDVLRDAKAMTQSPKVASKRIMQYTAKFGGFFASYHCFRKVLKLYVPQPPEMNVMSAAVLSIIPLVAVPSLRPMVPYAIMLIGLDALNGINDI